MFQLDMIGIDCGIIDADSIIAGKGAVNGLPSLSLTEKLAQRSISVYVIGESFKKWDNIHLEDGFEFIPTKLITDVWSDEEF